MSEKNADRRFEANTLSVEDLTLVHVETPQASPKAPAASQRTKKELVQRLIEFVEKKLE